jgi:hypothetical protein
MYRARLIAQLPVQPELSAVANAQAQGNLVGLHVAKVTHGLCYSSEQPIRPALHSLLIIYYSSEQVMLNDA